MTAADASGRVVRRRAAASSSGSLVDEDAPAPAPAPAPVKRRFRRDVGWGTYVSGALIVLWCLLPFYWMIVVAFRDVGHTFDTTLWPTYLTFDNFKLALDASGGNNLLKAIANSLIISGITTVVAVLLGVTVSYAIARLKFRGKQLVTGIILAASMFPGIALVTPLFQLFTNIQWLGTYQALIIPNISFALPLTIYTLTSFLHDLPWELEEAARVDGATRRQAFMRVILPLAAPAVFTTAILAFIATWNEYLLASQLSRPNVEPVTVSIARFAGPNPYIQPYAAIMAAGTIVTVPLVILVLVLQRRIVAGLTAGGVKS